MNTPPGNSTPGSRQKTRDTLREDVHDTVDHARSGAAGRVEGLAESLDAAADQLSKEDMTRLSGYVHDMAQSLTSFAGDLEQRSGDDMLHELSALARRNPAAFVGGSIALGFGLSRFARARSDRDHTDRQLPVPADQASASFGNTQAGSSQAGSTQAGSSTYSGTSYAGAPYAGATPPSTTGGTR